MKRKILLGLILLMNWIPGRGDEAGASIRAMEIKMITLQNDVCEAKITTQPFVHLISFRLLKARNHLIDFDSPNPEVNGRKVRPDFVAGAKLWYAPEVPGSHVFGMLQGEVRQQGNEVDVVLKRDEEPGLQGTIRFVLDKARPLLTITSRIENVGTKERETSCWWPVTFEPGGRMEGIPMPAPSDPLYTYHFWSYGGTASEPACHIEKEKVTLDLDRPLQTPNFKIGFIGREITVYKLDCAYRLTIVQPEVNWQTHYPHGGSPLMLYRDQKSLFCEAELSGPLVPLQPGEATSFTFTFEAEPVSKG